MTDQVQAPTASGAGPQQPGRRATWLPAEEPSNHSMLTLVITTFGFAAAISFVGAALLGLSMST
jgi:hypothetical protein